MIKKFWKSESFYLSIVLLFTLIIYTVIINIFPKFYMDDYEIFYDVSRHNSNWFYINPHNHFFLSLRPISYLKFKLDYILWGTNALGMKFEAIAIHLFLIIIYFKIIVLISRFLNIKINFKIISLFVLIFSINPDSSIWIFVINNQTELLGTLFYSLAILSVLKFLIDEPKYYYLIIYLLSYCIAIYSKQQPLHLPLLIIFLLMIFKRRIQQQKYQAVLLFSFLAFILMIFSSYINTHFSIYSLSFWDLMKKPISAVGIITYSIFSTYTDYLYYFALLHKTYAIVISVIIILATYYIFLRNKVNIKPFLLFIIGYIIILYPRIYVGYSERINSIIIFWSIIVLYVIYNKILTFNHKPVLPWIYSVLIFSALIINCMNYNGSFTILEKQTKALITSLSLSKSSSPTYIAYGFLPYLIPYELYYEKNRKFGEDTDLIVLPITSFLISPIFSHNFKKPVSFVSDSNNEIEIYVPSSKFTFYPDQVSKLYNYLRPIALEKKPRGYAKVKMSVRKIKNHKIRIIYYDGEKWRRVAFSS